MSSILVFIITTLCSMVPIIEIRGAMPLGMSSSLWGDASLTPLFSWLACLIGGSLACILSVLIFIPLRKVLSRFKLFKKIFTYCDTSVINWFIKYKSKRKSQKNIKKLAKNTKNNENSQNFTTFTQKNISFSKTSPPQKNTKSQSPTFIKALIVYIFCAIPLPLSGVWSAGALCSILNLSPLYSILSLLLANLTTCIIIGIFCSILEEFINLVLSIGIIISLLIAIYYALSKLLSKQKIAKSKN